MNVEKPGGRIGFLLDVRELLDFSDTPQQEGSLGVQPGIGYVEKGDVECFYFM